MSAFREYTHLIKSLEVYPRLHYFNKRYTDLKEKFKKFKEKYVKILPRDSIEAPRNYFEHGLAVKVIGEKDLDPNVFVACEPHLHKVLQSREGSQVDYIVPVNPYQDKIRLSSSSSKSDLKSSEDGTRADGGTKSPSRPEITVIILNVTVESLDDEGLKRIEFLWKSIARKKGKLIQDFFLLCRSEKEFSSLEEKEFRRKIECIFATDCMPCKVVIGASTVEIKSEISLHLESKLVQYFVTVQSILQPYTKGKKGNYSTSPLLEEETVVRQMKGFLENGLGLYKLEPEPAPASAKSKKYTDTLISRFSRVFKCAVILPLSEKYNIPVGLCNHILTEKKLEQNVSGKFSNAIPYHLKKLDYVAKQCRDTFADTGIILPIDSFQTKSFDFILTTLQADLADIVTETERVLSRFASTVRKILFEISSCLKKSKVDIVQIQGLVQRPAAKVDISIRNEILGMKDVYGVGTIYGELEIHVNSKEAIDAVKLEVRDLLRKNNVFVPFIVRAVEGNVKLLADNHCFYEHGERIECQTRMGTLAGFVEGDNGKLYGLTCAHVVKGQTEKDVLINDSSRNELILFAKSHPDLIVSTGDERRPLIDLAALQVIDYMKIKCCKFLKDDNCMLNAGIIAADTPVQLAGEYVYKHGAITQCTKGLVCSDDYSILSADEHGYVILIENYDDDDDADDADAFALPGDSGSMICAPDENEVYIVKAIGILSAGNFTPAGEETRKFFSFRLVDGLRKLSSRAKGVKFNFPKIV